jgi:hypothetical protein
MDVTRVETSKDHINVPVLIKADARGVGGVSVCRCAEQSNDAAPCLHCKALCTVFVSTKDVRASSLLEEEVGSTVGEHSGIVSAVRLLLENWITRALFPTTANQIGAKKPPIDQLQCLGIAVFVDGVRPHQICHEIIVLKDKVGACKKAMSRKQLTHPDI